MSTTTQRRHFWRCRKDIREPTTTKSGQMNEGSGSGSGSSQKIYGTKANLGTAVALAYELFKSAGPMIRRCIAAFQEAWYAIFCYQIWRVVYRTQTESNCHTATVLPISHKPTCTSHFKPAASAAFLHRSTGSVTGSKLALKEPRNVP